MMTAPPGCQGMLDTVFGALNLGMVVLDNARRVVLWNRWMAQYSGLSQERVLGADFFELFPELNGKRIDSAVAQALRDSFPSVLSQTLHKAPLPLFSQLATGPLPRERMQQAVAVTPLEVAGAARHCLIQVTDVTAAVHRERLLREQALELRSQSFSDGLTGIANRRHFDVAMDKEIRRAKRAASALSMLMIDIDSFKAYNDQYGHQMGDLCLIKVTTALAAMLQRPLDLIARYGGEEFAVILPELDRVQSLRMAEAMRRRVAELEIPHVSVGPSRHVTVSIGVATRGPDSAAEIADLIGAADRGLYIAKRNGRNQVVAQEPNQASA